MSTLDSKLEVPQRIFSPRARASLKQLLGRWTSEQTSKEYEPSLDGGGPLEIKIFSMSSAPETWVRISKDTYELSEVI